MTSAGSTARTQRVGSATAWRIVQVAGWSVAAALYLYLTVRVLSGYAGAGVGEPWGLYSFVDFRDTITTPVGDLLAGHNPYDIPAYEQRHPGHQQFNLYLPHHFVVFGWLGLLPSAVGIVMMTALTTAALVWLAREGFRLALPWWQAGTLGSGPRAAALAWTVVLVMSRPPGVVGIRGGQIAVLLSAAAWFALSRTQRWPVAAAIALTCIKPQVGLALIVALVGLRRTADVVRGVMLAAAMSIPVALWAAVNAGGLGALVDSMLANLRDSSTDEAFLSSPLDIAMTARAAGLVGPGLAVDLIMLGAMLVLVLVLRRATTPRHRAAQRGQSRGQLDTLVVLFLATLTSVVTTPAMRYSAAALIPPLIAVLVILVRRQARGSRALTLGVAWVCLVVALVRSETLDTWVGVSVDLARAVSGILFAAATLVVVATAMGGRDSLSEASSRRTASRTS